MTDRSAKPTPPPSPLKAPLAPEGPVEVVLGPGTRKALEGILGQAAGAVIVAAIEGAGYPLDDRWMLTIERAVLTRRPLPPPEGGNGAGAVGPN